MRRRRWAPLAAACLVALAALLAAVHGGGGGGGARGAAAPMPATRRPEASARVAAFDAARCKRPRNRAGAACARLPAAGAGDDDDDKRVVPTGSNPLHNR